MVNFTLSSLQMLYVVLCTYFSQRNSPFRVHYTAYVSLCGAHERSAHLPGFWTVQPHSESKNNLSHIVFYTNVGTSFFTCGYFFYSLLDVHIGIARNFQSKVWSGRWR